MQQIFTLANLVTLVRLCLCFPIFYLLWTDQNKSLVIALFLAAALTDVLDGYLARKRNEVSAVGKLLDPVADKLLVVGTLVALTVRGSIPLLWIVLLAAKEASMLLGGLILLGTARRVIAARPLGKLATVVLVSGITGVLVGLDTLGRSLVGLGTLLSLGAGLDYLLLLLRNR